MKIKTKIILNLLLISFLLLGVTTSITYFNTKKAITQTVLSNLDTIATIQKHQIINNINNSIEKLNLLKNRLGIKNNLDKYNHDPKNEYLSNILENLNNVLPHIKSFKNISIINNSGKIIVSTDKDLLDLDFSHNDAFIDGLKKDTIDSFFINKNTPSVYFSGPIMENNKVLGVALIESYPEQLLPINHRFTGLGETGEVTSAKKMKNGHVLAISPLRFMSDSFLKLDIPVTETKRPIIQAISGKENIFTDMINYRGKKILTVTRFIPQTNWGITVNVDQEEIFSPVYNLQHLILIMLLITSFLIIAISIYISRQITEPISKMTLAALEISKGNLPEKVIRESDDEIGILAKAFNQMTENLLKANQGLNEEIILRKNIEAELERFAYVSSHDLQEPLRTITSFTQLLEMKYKDKIDDEANEYIALVTQAAKRMKTLINDLLAYTKLGYEKKDFKPVDFNKILNYVLTNMQSIIDINGVIVKYENLPTLKANHILMIQLFQNIIGNAISFKSNQSPEVIISAEQINSEWVFSIADNGIGIDKRYFNKIFIPFQQLRRNPNKGTGIGLTICKKIIEIHNGRIWLESEENKGATFFFSLPE